MITVDALRAETATAFLGDTVLGGPDPDVFALEVIEGATGLSTLSMIDAVTDCSVSVPCIAVGQDDKDMNPDPNGRLLYMASAGTLEITSTAPYNIVGSLSNVTLVQVAVDIETSAVTVVEGGQCLELPSFDFGLEPPAVDWTCLPTAYDEEGQGLPFPSCDCLCGTDPDCTNPGNAIEGCEIGQTCGSTGCEQAPTAWTCAAAQYDGGPGNGCDCDCGTTDPDCDLPGEDVDNCPQPNSSCNRWAACVPDEWVCDPDYLGDTSCDCGCGAADPDCEDLSIFSCVFCPEEGCGNDELTPFGCDLNKFNNSGNNAVCL